ncbi:MAG TPA: FAD-binding oxidoreductase [Thermoleophilaceae bacterium]|nr:FAD-binding oxidoreductase [Thermoleophilaceae bacterium]
MSIAISNFEELRFRLGGALHEPGSAEYEDTCSLFNGAIDRRPRAVARCAAADDVVAALACARAEGLPVSVRAGGHSVAGVCLVDDGLVLDVRDMADVEVDPGRRVARVGGGATWAQVDRATQEHGLATTGGRVSTTGVAGLTMGGGSGWLERQHGLACDNLLAAELVTAEGELVRADAAQNPELLWALKGGGGNFGVVTAMEFRLYPIASELLAGFVVHPASRRADLLRLAREVMADAPEQLGIGLLSIAAAPELEGIPEELQGRPAVLLGGMFDGSVAEGEQALAALRSYGPPAADFFMPTTYADFQCALDDPPGLRNWWTAEQVPALTDAAIADVDALTARMPGEGSQMFVVPWGGQVARGAGHSPLAGRDAAWVVHPLLMWQDPAQDQAMAEYGRGFREAMRPHGSGQTYPNFIGQEGEDRVKAGFGAYNARRLAQVKACWDAGNAFHGNHNIQPAGDGSRAA